MSIKEILENSITGNVIGALSLLVSMIGLSITAITMDSAKKIQKQMEAFKIDTLEKSRFQDFKPRALEKITRHIISVERAQALSKKECTNMRQIITEVAGYEKILTTKDCDEIREIYLQVKEISLKKNFDDNDIPIIVEELTKLKNILEKGDYKL